MREPALSALTPAPRAGPEECRCVCGSLVARLVEAGVELKCRRCKRTLVVPVSGPPAALGCVAATRTAAGAAPGRGGAARVPTPGSARRSSG